jgi:hypothetical protein
MGVNVPSAKGVEWKSRDVAASRWAFDVGYERVFGHRDLAGNVDSVMRVDRPESEGETGEVS